MWGPIALGVNAWLSAARGPLGPHGPYDDPEYQATSPRCPPILGTDQVKYRRPVKHTPTCSSFPHHSRGAILDSSCFNKAIRLVPDHDAESLADTRYEYFGP